ncbi:hypothetical protein MUP79_00620, partial [Candidatus Bathyarchaeota archaeon]|nr:hypothetical protein [Candidatus Bathyarchaeota archaeon]
MLRLLSSMLDLSIEAIAEACLLEPRAPGNPLWDPNADILGIGIIDNARDTGTVASARIPSLLLLTCPANLQKMFPFPRSIHLFIC